MRWPESSWLANWRADLATLRALEPGRDPLVELLADAAAWLVVLVDVLVLAALFAGTQA